MSLPLTVTLSDSEVAEMVELGQSIYPDATLPELGEWAIATAKNGLRSEVARLKLQVQMQQENEARRTEVAEFEAAWPIEPDPLAPEPVEEEPVEEPVE